MPSKAIPALYTCYLLRSTTKPGAQPYIGSTPHPLRRWRQHNSLAKGGANRTAKSTYQPWEMCLIVHGFPSKLAALQFEWAWQNTEVTRHVREIGYAEGVGSPSTKGKSRVKGNASASVAKKLADLHALLQSKSFSRWPLGIRFFAKDVHRTWALWCERSSQTIRAGIIVTVDALATDITDTKAKQSKNSVFVPPGSDVAQENASGYPVQPSLALLDAGYSSLGPHLRKSTSLFLADHPIACAVCNHIIETSAPLTMICPHHDCNSTSHLTCLSRHFQETNQERLIILPTAGSCPGCRRSTTWISMAKELSIRVADPALAAKILKPPRNAKQDINVVEDMDEEDDPNDSDDDYAYQELMAAEAQLQEEIRNNSALSPVPDGNFLPIDEMLGESSDLPPSGQVPNTTWSSPQVFMRAVIPDSEWDDAEIVE